MNSKNPFFFRELSVDFPFCDRTHELEQLLRHVEGRANVVLFSPRRYGKTSLVRRVQHGLSQEGFITFFVDFFGITSLEEVSSRIARSVFEVIHSHESLFKKGLRFFKSFRPVLKPDEKGAFNVSLEMVSPHQKGEELLNETMEALENFAREVSGKIHVAFDEFQELTTLPQYVQIEGILRSHIQKHPFSYFFIGSRRRVLLSMFNERKRPFFQSAINFELNCLPKEELVSFLQELFKKGKKACSADMASLIADTVHQHPYYAQKLSYFIFETAGAKIRREDLDRGIALLLNSERPVFEAILQGLAPKQIRLLQALAKEPSATLFSLDYIKRQNLSSTGAIHGALKKLSLLDLLEQDKQGCWKVVDPIFAQWLKNKKE